MRRSHWIASFTVLLLAVALASPALALNFLDDNCLENPFIVDTAPEVARVANGYNCPGVDLTINTSLTGIVDPSLLITAKSVSIIGPDILDPAGGRVLIINDVAGSDIVIRATNGDLKLSEASIKTHHIMNLECDGVTPPCKIKADLSDIIASLSFTPLGPGGEVHIRANGDVDIKRTTVHGGDKLEIKSLNGGITLICKPGEAGCKDPFAAPFKAKDLCGDPPAFPCTVIFPDAKSLKEVCIQTPGVVCNGGSVEKRLTAKFDIDITGSTITSVEHITFTSSAGALKGKGATILGGDNIRIDVKNPIDLSEANLTAVGSVIILAGAGCPAAPAVCINAEKAKMEGKEISISANNKAGVVDLCGATLDDLGVDRPTLNGDTTPPFGPNVLEDSLECPTPPGPATIN